MRGDSLKRLAGAAAITGGALRIFETFPLPLVSATLQFAYVITDLLLAIGLCGIYISRRARLGFAGLAGFVVSLAGLAILRVGVPVFSLFPRDGANSYLIGAAVTLLGTVVLGIAILVHRAFPRSAPILWIASLVVAVLLLPFAMGLALTIAGAGFGAGFVAAGTRLLNED